MSVYVTKDFAAHKYTKYSLPQYLLKGKFTFTDFANNNLITCHRWLQGSFCNMWNEKGKGKSNTKEVHFQVFFRVSFKRRKLFVPSTKYRFSSNEIKLVYFVLNEGYHSNFFKISWFTFCVIFKLNIGMYD